MVVYLYSIYDKVAREHGPIFAANNDDVAVRMYRNFAAKEAQFANVANDYELRLLGRFNLVSGIIEPMEIEKVGTDGETIS